MSVETADPKAIFRYRTVWISDTHLGSKGCRAEELSRFLKHVRCERLYLVGDIIDMWRLKGKWYWPATHNDVVRRLLNLARHGTQVIFVPGNHDEFARQFCGMDFGGIKTLPYAVHVTDDNRRLLTIHGDQFDLVVQHSRFVSILGSKAYESLLVLNRGYNAYRRFRNKPYLSISQIIKARVKKACTLISDFERTLASEAKRRGFDGVVCGHIHKAEHVAAADNGGVEYLNSGDWIESCTAVVEHPGGELQVLHVLPMLAAMDELVSDARAAGDTHAEPAMEPLPNIADLIRWDDGQLDRCHEPGLTFGKRRRQLVPE